MPQTVMQIGPVALRDLEIPSSIDFGGNQRLVVHKLYGGAEVVERLGPEPRSIQFGGVFTGQDAAERFRALDAIRISGSAVWLTWGSFRYKVVVQSLQARYDSAWWIRFSIRCSVGQDVVQSQTTSSIAQQIISDLSNAASFGALLSINVSSLSGVLSSPNALTPNTSDYNSAVAATNGLLSNVNATMSNASNDMAAGLPTTTRGEDLPTAFSSLSSAAERAASAASMRGYLMRISSNL